MSDRHAFTEGARVRVTWLDGTKSEHVIVMVSDPMIWIIHRGTELLIPVWGLQIEGIK